MSAIPIGGHKKYPTLKCAVCSEDFIANDVTIKPLGTMDARKWGVNPGDHVCMDCISDEILDEIDDD